jgi:enediyne biosynthesis protein E4
MLHDGVITPLIYRNLGVKNGVPQFVQVDADAKGEVVYFPAGPSADYDGNGRIDLFLVNWFEGNHCRLLRNTSPAGNWLKVKVLGRKMNRMGVGAVVKVAPYWAAGRSRPAMGMPVDRWPKRISDWVIGPP